MVEPVKRVVDIVVVTEGRCFSSEKAALRTR